MTREEAIEIIQKLIGRFKSDSRTYKALEMAIQALSQEPCDDAVSREYLKKIAQSEGAYGYVSAHDIATAPSVTPMRDATPKEQKSVNDYIKSISTPTGIKFNDAISREAVDKYIARLLSGYLYDGERERLEIFSAYLWELPSVTQKSETVTEFADRCRECGARYGKLLEQKSGKWERHYIRPNVYKDLLWYCSACGIGCGYNNAFMFDYCPNCGAKMESEDKE